MTSNGGFQFPSIIDQDGARLGRVPKEDIDLPIANWAVSVVELSRLPFLRLRFAAQDSPDQEEKQGYTLAVEGSMLIVVNGTEHWIDPPPGGDPAYFALALKTVLSAVASQDGGLVVVFTDGDRLEVPRDDHYEPWQLAGDDGSLVVSSAGGGLAVWGADPRKG